VRTNHALGIAGDKQLVAQLVDATAFDDRNYRNRVDDVDSWLIHLLLALLLVNARGQQAN
jgi:hypothetical protein